MQTKIIKGYRRLINYASLQALVNGNYFFTGASSPIRNNDEEALIHSFEDKEVIKYYLCIINMIVDTKRTIMLGIAILCLLG